MFVLVNTGLIILIVATFVIAYGVCQNALAGAQGAWFPELFNANTRASGASLAYQISAMVSGFTPFITTLLFEWIGWMGPALLFSGYMAIGLVAAIATRETWGPRERRLADKATVRRRPRAGRLMRRRDDVEHAAAVAGYRMRHHALTWGRRRGRVTSGRRSAPPTCSPRLRRPTALPRRRPALGRAGPVPAVDRPLRDRAVRRARRGRHRRRRRARHLRQSDDSRLPMSGMASYTPGMEISGGSLGHGLTVAVGMALGLRHQGSTSRVINFLSDGELDEGSTWEAAMGASHHRLGNLIAMVDINALQADGPTAGVLRTEPVADKWAACGWFTQRVDGNDVGALLEAFDEVANVERRPARPRSSCATPGSAAACRCWRTARRRTSCASTPTSGRSAASSSTAGYEGVPV